METKNYTQNLITHQMDKDTGKASWETHGHKGQRFMKVDGHLDARWVSIVLTESGTKTSKTVFATLDESEVHELYMMLDRVLFERTRVLETL
jgi:hypothetical protein